MIFFYCRPSKCSTCSVSFPLSSLADHHPHCSHITLPSSLTGTVDKVSTEGGKEGGVGKWVELRKGRMGKQARDGGSESERGEMERVRVGRDGGRKGRGGWCCLGPHARLMLHGYCNYPRSIAVHHRV